MSRDQQNDVPGLRSWMEAVTRELGIPESVVVPGPLLDTARDVANGVLRPGAPMTTYLIGVALGLQLAGRDGSGEPTEDIGQRVEDLAARVQDLVTRYDAEATMTGAGTEGTAASGSER